MESRTRPDFGRDVESQKKQGSTTEMTSETEVCK